MGIPMDILMEIPMDILMEIPMGIPRMRWEWKLKFHSHGNPGYNSYNYT